MSNSSVDFKRITDEMICLYEKKNTDYGSSFSETYEKLGILSAVTRLTDKMNRITTLATKGENKVKNESLRDSLIDLANYAVMTIIELDKRCEHETKD